MVCIVMRGVMLERRDECESAWYARLCLVCALPLTSLISCFCSSVSSILAERAGALVDEADFLYVDDMVRGAGRGLGGRKRTRAREHCWNVSL